MGSVCFPCLNVNHGWIPAGPSIYRGIQHRGGEKLSVGKFYPEDKEMVRSSPYLVNSGGFLNHPRLGFAKPS
jgi:hypothetical protein